MATVGIRELKSRLSHYMKRVQRGERITVTDRGASVAVIGPAVASPRTERLDAMLRTGAARWAGGKPRGSARPARRVHGPSVADAIIEDRR
jgi:prevent-host-death family protein